LNYAPDRDSSLSHLKTTYHKYLADLFVKHAERESEQKETTAEQTDLSAQD